jgi:hypothetical protein
MSLERSELMRSTVVPGPQPAAPDGRRAAHAAVVLGLVGLGLLVHRDTFSYGLVGNDTYPQILTSRIETAADFWDNLRKPLAQGYLEASFYRPVQSSSIALDEALWGLRPAGYQLSTMVVFGACVGLLYLALRRLLGGGAVLAPAVGTLFFVLHPTLLTVLPAPCRRAELLVSLFLLAALLASPVRAGRGFWLRCVLAGLSVLLAAASKEVGLVGVGLVFLHQLLFAGERPPGRGTARAALATLPTLAGAVLYLAARTIVLGGLGGYTFKDREPFFELLPRWCGQLAVDALCPWSFVADLPPLAVALLPLTILGVLAAACVAGSFRPRARDTRRAAWLVLLGLAWIVPLVLVLGLNQLYGPWYALVPLVGLSLVVAGLAQAIRSMDTARPRRWLLRGLLGAALLVGLAVPLRASPLYTKYTCWRRASELLEQAQADIDAALADARDGERVTVRIPVRVTPRAPQQRPFEPSDERPRVYGAVILKYEGVAAWVALRYPQRSVRVVWDARPPLPSADAGEVLLLAYPDRSGLR